MKEEIVLSNIKQIVSIKVRDEDWHDQYHYHTESKSFWGKIFRGGYYYWGEIFTEEQVKEKGFLVKDNKVYFKPRVVVIFTDGSCEVFKFDTYEQTIQCKKRLVEMCSSHNVPLKHLKEAIK